MFTLDDAKRSRYGSWQIKDIVEDAETKCWTKPGQDSPVRVRVHGRYVLAYVWFAYQALLKEDKNQPIFGSGDYKLDYIRKHNTCGNTLCCNPAHWPPIEDKKAYDPKLERDIRGFIDFEVREAIRSDYIDGLTGTQLSVIYHLAPSTIYNIVRYEKSYVNDLSESKFTLRLIKRRSSTLTYEDRQDIRRQYKEGVKIRDIQEQYELTGSTIYNIVTYAGSYSKDWV